MTCNVSEAEDLTQEVFIHLMRKLGGIRGESSLGTWLHRLTVNQVRMHFRRNRARREHAHDPHEERDATQTTSGAEREGRTPVIEQIALADALAIARRLPHGLRAPRR